MGQIGDVYRFQEDYDFAQKYYERALMEVRRKTNYPSESINKQYSVLLVNLGQIYSLKQEWEKAYDKFHRAFEISIELYSKSKSHEKMTKVIFGLLANSISKHKSCTIDEAKIQVTELLENKLGQLNKSELLDTIVR